MQHLSLAAEPPSEQCLLYVRTPSQPDESRPDRLVYPTLLSTRYRCFRV